MGGPEQALRAFFANKATGGLLLVLLIAILVLGALAFACSTAGGVLLAKALNLLLPRSQRLNPCIGAAGVSAVPMSVRTLPVCLSSASI